MDARGDGISSRVHDQADFKQTFVKTRPSKFNVLRDMVGYGAKVNKASSYR